MVQFVLCVFEGFVVCMCVGDVVDLLLCQVLLIDEEMCLVFGFSFDVVGDGVVKKVIGVIQKYCGCVLLVVIGSCVVNCCYCFCCYFDYGVENVVKGGWQEVVVVIVVDLDIDEVILFGGDLLLLVMYKLVELIDVLCVILYICCLCIYIWLLVVLLECVDDELVCWLGSLLWLLVVVVYVNYVNEFDVSVDVVMVCLCGVGVQLLNQVVLLCGVNDSVQVLQDLSECSFVVGVLFYYLYQLDWVEGVVYFEVDDVQVKVLIVGLIVCLFGYLILKLVCELFGDLSKCLL